MTNLLHTRMSALVLLFVAYESSVIVFC